MRKDASPEHTELKDGWAREGLDDHAGLGEKGRLSEDAGWASMLAGRD